MDYTKKLLNNNSKYNSPRKVSDLYHSSNLAEAV